MRPRLEPGPLEICLEKEKAHPADDILIDPRAAHAAPSGYGN